MQRLILLDWDDTLCPSSWLEAEGLSAQSGPEEWEPSLVALDRLEECIRRVLGVAQLLGTTYILTNAEEAWVAHSTGFLFPGLDLGNVPVFSACTHYQSVTGDYRAWKHHAVRDLVAHHEPTHVLGVGDAPHDCEAVLANRAGLVTDGLHRKVIRFLARPSLAQLCEQLERLEDWMLDEFMAEMTVGEPVEVRDVGHRGHARHREGGRKCCESVKEGKERAAKGDSDDASSGCRTS